MKDTNVYFHIIPQPLKQSILFGGARGQNQAKKRMPDREMYNYTRKRYGPFTFAGLLMTVLVAANTRMRDYLSRPIGPPIVKPRPSKPQKPTPAPIKPSPNKPERKPNRGQGFIA